MTVFILLAVALTVAVAGAVVIPLLRRNATTPAPAVWAAFAATAVLVFGAAALYAALSNWSWRTPAVAGDTPQSMVSRLARRLERNPDDLNGWLRLGRSYVVLEQYPLAVRAYSQAYSLTHGKDVEAVLGLGEALMFTDERMLEGRAGALFAQALQLAPHHPKALWYSGLAAYQRGRLDVARERWTALVALEPPPEIKRLLEKKLADIDRQLKNLTPAPLPIR